MEFFKSAVASAISKGPVLGYSLGNIVDTDQSIWTLHNGTKRDDGSKCSVFSFDMSASRSLLPLAKNAVRKLRTIRHPGIIKVLETVEADDHIYIFTERLVPLSLHTRRRSLAQDTIKWGLYSIAKTLSFLNGEANSVHGCVRVSSIFTSESGEWKLGGFDVLSSMKEDDAVIYTFGGLVPDAAHYALPEIVKGGWGIIKSNPLTAVDAYAFGTVIFETFNGNFRGADQLGEMNGIPPTMQSGYKRLLNPSPKTRSSIGQFLDQGRRAGGFFRTPLITLTEGIENLGLKSESERDQLLNILSDMTDIFPDEFVRLKILPELLKSVEFGGGGPNVFGHVMKIAAKLSDDEYNDQVTPVIIRLFQSPDRAIRVYLLNNLPLMIDHLSNRVVNDKIFPQIATGFSDTAPALREHTVKAVLTVVSRLAERTTNGELLRHLAKTANDEQPGIRTNTTICLGKIARNLSAASRSKVLTAAFGRALRDPFIHARDAALLALAATSDLYDDDECATKLLPAICPSLVDKEKVVRDQANKTMGIFLARVHKYQTTMADTAVPPSSAASVPRMSSPQQESSWAGWAISSFTNKLSTATGDVQTSDGARSRSNQDSNVAATSRSSPMPAASSLDSTSRMGSIGAPSAVRRQSLDKPEPSIPSGPHVPLHVEAEDFGAAWSAELSGVENDMRGSVDNAADDDFDPFSPPKSNPGQEMHAVSASLDNNGEPDFARWLNERTQSKSDAKKLFPKGLAKTKVAAGTTAKEKTGSERLPDTKRQEAVGDMDQNWEDAWD